MIETAKQQERAILVGVELQETELLTETTQTITLMTLRELRQDSLLNQ